ncbi:MAG: FeS assembly SUF system protein [Bacteroidetes bacterium]|nr:MAG: FeS assembly SUF system protein [Bacteroidota bacterium]
MLNKDEIKVLEEKIIVVLKNIFDPEIPVNIYDLGLIYESKVNEEGIVNVLMTLTSPNCPVAESMPAQVQEEISFLTGVTKVDLELTFEPPWDQEMITEEAKLELGLL